MASPLRVALHAIVDHHEAAEPADARARADLLAQVGRRIVGQTDVLDGILTAVFSGGHALLLGVPGLAKTLMVQTVAQTLDLKFSRIQFTPDLMPTDITGTEIIEEDQATGKRAL